MSLIPTGSTIDFFPGLVAFLEGLLFMKWEKAITIGAIVALAGLIPSSPIPSMPYNEALWETIIASLVGGAVLTGVWDGGFGRNLFLTFILDTSSRTFSNA